MIKKIFILLICLLPLNLMGTLPSDPVEYEAWERSVLDGIQARTKSSPEVAIPKLGSLVLQLNLGSNIETGERPVFRAAQAALLSIPGHAKYYKDQIEQTRALLKHYESLSWDEQRRMEEEYRERKEDLGSHLNYRVVCGNAFVILGLLPSPESVAVLGHFLEDPEGRDGRDVLGNPIHTGSDVVAPLPNCGKAYYAMEKLGIEHPPIPPSPYEDMPVELNQERVDAWKQWWNEVKSGKRTYRFKGSNIEYGPEGPATGELLERAARQHQRREDRTSVGDKSSPASSQPPGPSVQTAHPSTYAIIAAGVALLGSIAWYFRKTRSGIL